MIFCSPDPYLSNAFEKKIDESYRLFPNIRCACEIIGCMTIALK